MSSALDVIKSVNPPRTVFLDFPLGHTTGKPNEPSLQHDILIQALDAFKTLKSPGEVMKLSHKWDEHDSWLEGDTLAGDVRQQRFETPQYQVEEDRKRVEGGI